MRLQELKGANIDIDLASNEDLTWKHEKCPWNEHDNINEHKCAVKGISICNYFCGIGSKTTSEQDTVWCCFPIDS